MKKILELGAGKNPYIGGKNEKVIHLDIKKFPHIEVVHDLNIFPYPFKKNEFDEIIARHVLEHLDDLTKVMKELWRILKPSGILKIWVPYFASPSAYTDLTHKHFFTLKSFDYWDENTDIGKSLGYEIGNVKFKVIKRELHFHRICKLLGIDLLAKRFSNIYESYLSRIFPAYEVFFELKAIKNMTLNLIYKNHY